MSASEKLRALGDIWGSEDEGVTYEQVGRSAETVRLALPQLLAVVEAAERVLIEKNGTLRQEDRVRAMRAALAALDRALTVDGKE